jgi:hypothetical protein
MRQIRDDESRTIEERIRANDLLGVLLERQLREELKIAGTRLEMAKMNLDQNKDNVDAIVAVIEAETELIDIRERITGQRSEQLTNENALLREQAEMQVKSVAVVEDSEAQKIQSKISASKITRKMVVDEMNLAMESRDKRIMYEQQVADTKKAIAMNLLGAIGQFAEQGSALAKAAAVGQTLMATYESAVQAYKAALTLGAPGLVLAPIAAASAALFGLSNVKRILATDNSGRGGSNPIISYSGTVQSPSITIPGQSGINSIVAGFQNNNGPVQAYVLAGQVTSAQELQRKKLANATFG